MPQYLAIATYRSLVSGVSSGRLDIQVRWFELSDEEAVRSAIESEPISRYKNSDDEAVTWELVEILQVEPFEPENSGDEVVGFIASVDELEGMV